MISAEFSHRLYQIDGGWNSADELITLGWKLKPITEAESKKGILEIEETLKNHPQLAERALLATIELIPADEFFGNIKTIGEGAADRLTVLGYLVTKFEFDESQYATTPMEALSLIGDRINYAFTHPHLSRSAEGKNLPNVT